MREFAKQVGLYFENLRRKESENTIWMSCRNNIQNRLTTYHIIHTNRTTVINLAQTNLFNSSTELSRKNTNKSTVRNSTSKTQSISLGDNDSQMIMHVNKWMNVLSIQRLMIMVKNGPSANSVSSKGSSRSMQRRRHKWYENECTLS